MTNVNATTWIKKKHFTSSHMFQYTVTQCINNLDHHLKYSSQKDKNTQKAMMHYETSCFERICYKFQNVNAF